MAAPPWNGPFNTRESRPFLRFGVFELDRQSGELRKHGQKMRLRPQAAKVLVLLASRAGELVTRDELKQNIWGPDTFGDFEHGLNLCIRLIRGALNDDAETPRYVETVPRQGYRFIAPVEDVRQQKPVPSVEAATAPASMPSRRIFWTTVAVAVGLVQSQLSSPIRDSGARGC